MVTPRKQYLTIAEVAGMLGVGRTTVYQLRKRGELRAAVLRGTAAVRFDPAEVEEYVARSRRPARKGRG